MGDGREGESRVSERGRERKGREGREAVLRERERQREAGSGPHTLGWATQGPFCLLLAARPSGVNAYGTKRVWYRHLLVLVPFQESSRLGKLGLGIVVCIWMLPTSSDRTCLREEKASWYTGRGMAVRHQLYGTVPKHPSTSIPTDLVGNYQMIKVTEQRVIS